MNRQYELSREVLQQHHEQAFKWAMSCCNYDFDRAREVMQLVYIEILENRAVFRGESGLRTWLFAVVRRVAWRQSRLLKSADNLKSAATELIESEPAVSDGSERLEQQQTVRRVMDALMQLSLQQRQVIELVYYREFTLEEAAGILGIGIGSARTHFHRAKQQLAKKLQSIRE